MRQMSMLMYIKGMMMPSDFSYFVICNQLWLMNECEICNDLCRIRVATAVSSLTRPPSNRRLTGQKTAVSNNHLFVNCAFS